MNEIIHRQFHRVERTVDGVKRVLFVASTGNPDRYADIVDQQTWRLDNYRANPVVLVNHDYSVQSTVGSGAVEVMDGNLTLEVVKWSSKPLASEVKVDVDDGIINAVSVGFRPGRMIPRSQMPEEDPRRGERGYVYYDCELLEVSIVTIPANAEALAAKTLRASDVVAALLSDATFKAELLAHITLSGATAPECGLLDFPSGQETPNLFGFKP